MSRVSIKQNVSEGFQFYEINEKENEREMKVERVVQLIYCSDNIGGGWCSATHNKEENKSLQ